MNSNDNLEKLVRDFTKVAELSKAKLTPIEINNSPPFVLPNGKMAIYVFFLNSECLKVGKVGAKSQSRYSNQHYNPNSSRSNLAKSILQEQVQLNLSGLSNENIDIWIRTNVERVNFLLDSNCGIRTLNLFEAFVQSRLKPKFEGFKSQR